MCLCLGWVTLLFQFSDSIRECGCQKRVVTRTALKPSLAITWFVKGHGPSNVQGRSSGWWEDEGVLPRLAFSYTSSTTAGNPRKGVALNWPELSDFCTHFVLAFPQSWWKLHLPASLGCRNEDYLLAPGCKPNETSPDSVCQGRILTHRNWVSLTFPSLSEVPYTSPSVP